MLRQEAEEGSYSRATTPLGSTAPEQSLTASTDRAGLAHLLETRPHFSRRAREQTTELARELQLSQRAGAERESRGVISGGGAGGGAGGAGGGGAGGAAGGAADGIIGALEPLDLKLLAPDLFPNGSTFTAENGTLCSDP